MSLSDPEGLKLQKERLTQKLEGLEKGTQAYSRTQLMLAEVVEELAEIEAVKPTADPAK